MTQAEFVAEEIYDGMKGFRVKNSHRKKCAVYAAKLVLKYLEVTTGHCTLNALDQNEVALDKDFWREVIETLEKK